MNNKTALPDHTLAELFDAQAARTPDAPAVVCGDVALSYGELDAAASRLAWYLIGQGAGPERVVAVAVERSAAMVTAMLAVAKAGAACLPVDPAYPAARTALMLADADVTAVITTSRVAEAVPPPAGAPQVLLDDPEVAAQVGACPAVGPGDGDRIVPLRPAHPAYVLYVSGSAGVPQGVVGTNAALAGRLVWFAGAFAEWQRQVACARSSVSSIDGLAELVGPLLAGQLVVLADETEARDPAALVALMARHETECVTVVPGMLASLLANGNAGPLGSCGFWVSTGEALSGDDVSRLAQALPEARLLNRYGVTEAGGGNVVAECRDGEEVVIGGRRPIPGCSYWTDRCDRCHRG